MTLLFIFLKGMLGLCTYMPDVIFSLQNLKISGPEIPDILNFRFFSLEINVLVRALMVGIIVRWRLSRRKDGSYRTPMLPADFIDKVL